ncbi:MAG: hypothetical protein AB7D33_03485 [Sphingobium sp.]
MTKYGFPSDDEIETPPISLPSPKAKTAKPEPQLLEEAVKAGREMGFVPREPESKANAQVRRAGRRKTEPQDKILIAGPARVIEEFRSFCDEQNMPSYWLALETLMKQAKGR